MGVPAREADHPLSCPIQGERSNESREGHGIFLMAVQGPWRLRFDHSLVNNIEYLSTEHPALSY